MKAVIMAGGKGTRLYPLTLQLPKPMISMFNLPVIEYTLMHLRAAGITQIAITLQFMPQYIMDYLGSGEKFGVNISYFSEDKPLGTAGSVKNAEEFLDQDFLVVSGDAVCNFNFNEAKNFHNQNNADVTMLLYSVQEPLEYGVVVCNENNEVIRFIEKPPWSKAFSDTVNTGIYLCKKEVLKLIPKGKFFDFSKDLFPNMLLEKKRIMGYMANGYWCDIGDLRSYLNCHFDVLDNKNNIGLLLNDRNLNQQSYSKYDNNSKTDIKIINPCFIGKNVQIGNKSSIGPYAIIEDDCIIGNNTSIKNSVIKNKTQIANLCQITGSIIDNQCIIENNSICLEGSVIGQGTIVGEGAIIMPNVSVWREKIIKKGQKVVNNIINDSTKTSPIFKDGSIEGTIEAQFTLENAVLMGKSIGGIYCEKRIIISCDEKPNSNLIKMLLSSGMCSAGAKLYYTENLNEGALCYLTRKLNCSLGIYIKSKQDDIIVSIYNELGIKAGHSTQRSIEKQFKNHCQFEISNKKISKPDKLEGTKNLYVDEIVSLYPILNKSKICISGSGLNLKFGLEVLNGIGFETSKNFEGQDIFYLNDDGLEIITVKNKVLREESLILLAALIFFKENIQAKFCVPVFAPDDVEEIAKKYGGRVQRLSSLLNDEFINQSHIYSIDLLNDPIRCLCHIACYCVSNNTTVDILLDEIPQSFLIKKDVDCIEIGRAALMKSLLSEAKKGKYELNEGIKIFNDKGFVLVIPQNHKDEYKIYAQGHTKEYAQEICDFYQDKIKTIKNNQSKKI